MVAWYSAENIEMTGSEVTKVYDMSGTGNHLDELDSAMSDDFPSYDTRTPPSGPVTVTANFKGKKVIKFDGTEDHAEHIRCQPATLSRAFGTSLSPIADPTWTIAGVIAENATSADQEVFLRLSDASGANKIELLRHNQGRRWIVRGSGNTGNHFDSAEGVWLEAPQTFVFTARDPDTGVDDSLHTMVMWAAGSAQVWTDTDDTTFELQSGTAGGAVETLIPNRIYLSHHPASQMDRGWYGSMAEIIVWAGSFSDAELQEATNYLSAKWGCA